MHICGIRVILTATLIVAAALTSATEASAAEPVKTTISHRAWNGNQSTPDWMNNPTCSRSVNADVWEPAASGKYPVAIVTVGTFGSITAPAYQELAKEFGRQGFVAAVADYNTFETIPIDINR